MEKVQLAQERFLPEYRDLLRRNLFDKDEVSDIVAKRKGFEVALASRDVKPADYLRYIEYEVKLEKLRKARASRIKITTKKTLSDHSIAAHVTHLHRLSTRRFPASIPLWNAFLAHSLTQSSPLLISRTLSSAIAMHPTHVAYWLMASRWEADGDEKGMGGGNEEAARRLCMRALRFLKGREADEGLVWKEWIRVECGFAERVRARWAVLGIGKGKGGEEEITIVGEKKMDVDGEEENAEVELPAVEGDEEEAAIKREVERQALSGQEAIIDGAIVRVVIDNCLSSFSHSLSAYQLVLSVLRPLPSALRLSLLTHVYTSLTARFPSTSESYPSALHILATRTLYDLPFDPKQPKRPSEAEVASGEVLVEGERLVDAVGSTVEVYWKACKGRKGKGKGKEKAPVKVWEAFCAWLEEMAEEVEEENLSIFLTTNLTTALSLAPPSPFLSLLHLRHLLRTSAPHSTILALASSSTSSFGTPSPAVSLATTEQIWVARTEIVVSLSSSPTEIESTFKAALKVLPFSGRLWDVQAQWIERGAELSVEEVVEWYEAAVQRVLLADARPPVNFESTFVDEVLAPRELIPRRYLAFVSERMPSELQDKVARLLKVAPMLSMEFLVFVLEVVSEGMGFELVGSSSEEKKGKAERLFRELVWERVVAHPEAEADEWVAYADEMLKAGEVTKSGEVVRRAGRALRGGEKDRFDRRWTEICDQ